MAIEVLKHGNSYNKGICPICRCEFLYQNEDIHNEETRINAYESKTEYRYVKCPECGHKIAVFFP